MIMPAVMTIMTKKAGPSRMGRVMGVLGVPMLIAPIAGPILGGWLVDDVSWRWIFFINVPIGIVAFIAAYLKLDRDEPQPTHRLDWLGMALLSPGLTLLIFGLAETSSHGGRRAAGLGADRFGAPLIIAFLRHSLDRAGAAHRHPDLHAHACGRGRGRVPPLRHRDVRLAAAPAALLPEGPRRSRPCRPACCWRRRASAR